MKSFIYQSVGYIATRWTQTYIYSCVFVGLALSLALNGGIGYALGVAFGYGTECAYIGCALAAAYAVRNMPNIQAVAAQQISAIETLKSGL